MYALLKAMETGLGTSPTSVRDWVESRVAEFSGRRLISLSITIFLGVEAMGGGEQGWEKRNGSRGGGKGT